MNDTPKALRRHIAILGRRNAGKSSLLNAIAGQKVSIVSGIAGTTTDPVEKTMELKPLGPVVLIDTAGIDDTGELGTSRNERSFAILSRSDLALVVTDGDTWGEPEQKLLAKIGALPSVLARNKADTGLTSAEEWRKAHRLPQELPIVDVCAKTGQGVAELAYALSCQAGTEEHRPLLADLLPANGLALLVAPIDSGAPKGRLIMPQVQAIRDCLDHHKTCLVATDMELPEALRRIKPDLVVCDSQVAKTSAAYTPLDIPFTTFSILMARAKGDLRKFAAGASALASLKPGDKVLIQEACSHHAQEDDIGKVKIPRFLTRIAGGALDISHAQGKEMIEYDPNLKAIVHCGGCVITRRQMLSRQSQAKKQGIPMTNYGMAITLAQGLIQRALAPLGIDNEIEP